MYHVLRNEEQTAFGDGKLFVFQPEVYLAAQFMRFTRHRPGKAERFIMNMGVGDLDFKWCAVDLIQPDAVGIE